VGISLEDRHDVGRALVGVHAPEFSRRDAFLKDAGAPVDHLLPFLPEHNQHLSVRRRLRTRLAVGRGKDAHQLEHGLIHKEDAADVFHVLAALEDHLDELAELFAGTPRTIGDPGNPIPEVIEIMADDLEEEDALARDIFVDRGLGQLGLPGDVVHRQGAVALAQDDALGGVEDDLPVAFATAELAFAADVARFHGCIPISLINELMSLNREP
jgi:hypothetical protein